MKSFFSVVFLSAISISNCMAYIPTLESLLRNGENPTIGKNSLTAKIKIHPLQESGKSSILKNNEAIKYYLYNENGRSSKLVQLKYAANTFKLENLYQQKVLNFSRLDYLEKNTEKMEQRLYYSVLAMLLKNDGSFLIDFLKNMGFPVKKNQELLNRKKSYLLNRYTNYLKSDSGSNPLKGKTVEEQKKINKLYNAPLISEDGLVKRFKNGDHFSWVVDQEKLYISFDHNHHIEELSFEVAAGKFSVSFERFLLQGAGMEFPEKITFTLPNQKRFKLELVSLKKFGDNSRAYSKRLKANTKEIQKNNISVSTSEMSLTL